MHEGIGWVRKEHVSVSPLFFFSFFAFSPVVLLSFRLVVGTLDTAPFWSQRTEPKGSGGRAREAGGGWRGVEGGWWEEGVGRPSCCGHAREGFASLLGAHCNLASFPSGPDRATSPKIINVVGGGGAADGIGGAGSGAGAGPGAGGGGGEG